MKKLLLTALLACSVQAASIDLGSGGSTGVQSGSGLGNSYTFSNINGDGIDLTVTAFSLVGGASMFTDAQVGRYSPGMGVCNSGEGANCPADSHQLDNDGSYDFLLFQFSSPVLISGVSIYSTNNADTDAMYFLGNAVLGVDLDPPGANNGATVPGLTGLGFNAAIVSASTGSNPRTVTIANGGIAYNSLLFGAPDIDSDPDSYWSSTYQKFKNFSPDYFKVQGISYTTPPPNTDVPEPTSMALMGSALLGLGLIVRRRAVRK